MRKVLNYIIPIFICLIVGYISSILQSTSLTNWYPLLNKPVIMPPNIVFPIVWTIIYITIGLSLGILLNENNKKFIMLWCVQLFFNFLWSILFFTFRSPLLGLIDIILLIVFVMFYTTRSYKYNHNASYLFMPYLAWLFFATYLNFYVFINN